MMNNKSSLHLLYCYWFEAKKKPGKLQQFSRYINGLDGAATYQMLVSIGILPIMAHDKTELRSFAASRATLTI